MVLKERLVLAYSGGLDTSVMIKWIQEKYNYDVITLTLDLGQKEEMKDIEKRALKIGAIKHYSIDVKEEFVKDYIFKAIKANALYQNKYPLSTALARPLIAKKLVEIAHKEGARAVAHGCTGKGNDQVRFEVTIRALDPDLKIIAPVREWNMSRDEEINYALKKGIDIKPSKSRYSVDQNLWGRSIEGGELEDPSWEPSEEVFEWVILPEKAPDKPEYVKINFEGGIPTRLNDLDMNPVKLIEELNRIAGKNGVGIIDHMEDRLVGIKSREVYECPAALCLIEAHKDLEKLVLSRQELNFKAIVEKEWAWLVYSGLWVEPLRRDLEAFIDSTQLRVDGEVTLKLYKGNFRVVGRESKYSLYNYSLATYEGKSSFDQKDSEGFIKIWGLPSILAYREVKENF
ncbi:Argininosuccinate synthase [archaeon HR06]|nr:Argininosuccinate synthase [archaeon HR06]